MSSDANALLDAMSRGIEIIDLARPMVVGMPQSPNHPEFRLSMPRRPLTNAELRGKFEQNVDGLLKPDAAAFVADSLTSTTPDVRVVMNHLASVESPET